MPDAGDSLGRRILAESFALIERELGPHTLPPWAFAVVRRMIHASADFDFAHLLQSSFTFTEAIAAAFQAGVPLLTDTEMVRLGLATQAQRAGLPLLCYLNDPETTALAVEEGLTRSAAGIRVAARRHAMAVVVIGNAPTALEEALRLVHDKAWQPAAVIALPVGFVGVVEAKSRLLDQAAVPYLTCSGRKGGSAVTAAAVNALLEHFLP